MRSKLWDQVLHGTEQLFGGLGYLFDQHMD
jgi:hypothetical protein